MTDNDFRMYGNKHVIKKNNKNTKKKNRNDSERKLARIKYTVNILTYLL